MWQGLERLYEEGRAKAIGVSNFGVGAIEEMKEWAKVFPPMVNQIEASLPFSLFPRFSVPYRVWQSILITCEKEGQESRVMGHFKIEMASLTLVATPGANDLLFPSSTPGANNAPSSTTATRTTSSSKPTRPSSETKKRTIKHWSRYPRSWVEAPLKSSFDTASRRAGSAYPRAIRPAASPRMPTCMDSSYRVRICKRWMHWTKARTGRLWRLSRIESFCLRFECGLIA